ncbi:hypothetical protein [Robertmurraya siralis]|uniref:hypothetical protein n=1 Tax=Robertmurraya siralis TaxID=77777 RepID=UPI0010F754E8|nr:hypothetical protein [Robertmurraya siralis]
MQLTSLIYSMYEKSFNKPIFADCVLINDDVIVKGDVLLKMDSNNLELFIKEFFYKNMAKVSGKTSQYTIEIKNDSLPLNFYCEITNFPNDDRNVKFKNKDVAVKLHKVTLDSDFSFTLGNQDSRVKCDIIPMCDSKHGEIGEVIVL